MPNLELQTPVRFIRGIGPERSKHLAESGVNTVLDLLHVSPLNYEIRPQCRPIGDWREGEQVCVAGQIIRVRMGSGSRGPSVTAIMTDGQDRLRIVWFNAPYLRSRIRNHMFVCATGKLQVHDGGAQLVNPIFQLYSYEDELAVPKRESWRAIYAAVGSINSRAFEKTITNSLETLADLGDYLPPHLRAGHDLLPLPRALRQLHQPDSLTAAAEARRRLAYDELLIMQLKFARARRQRQSDDSAPPLGVTADIDQRIRRRLPFDLTGAQNRAVQDICRDLNRAQSMFRLLQGDVGSGKTAVAVYASLVTIANRRQVALLAPTEVLAQQHLDKISRYLDRSAVRVELISGSTSPAKRRALLQALGRGEVHWVLGTHALLEPDVQFQRLGLVIIDEQHRFGVIQRQALKSKVASAHYLVLSATPIPRTQALALMGDLDMSVIDQLPSGRGRVHTHLVRATDESSAWARIREDLDQGRQAYVIYPLIEESDKLPLRAVTSEFERLQRTVLHGYTCALLHGRMSTREKLEALAGFQRGTVQVLISTTVVEVGVDIPNATVMVVFHPQRYGLAQLHQLRGRISRGTHPGHFFMFTDTNEDAALQRLRILMRTNDGFEIAEADLKLRGPGQLLGTRQHGLPRFRYANLLADEQLLSWAREDASAMVAGHLRLDDLQKSLLKRLSDVYGDSSPALVHVA